MFERDRSREAMGNSFSGTSQRRQYQATETAQRAELDKQRAAAESAQAAAMQDNLARETNQLLRVFGSQSLLTSAR
jgi:hypothetical protein